MFIGSGAKNPAAFTSGDQALLDIISKFTGSFAALKMTRDEKFKFGVHRDLDLGWHFPRIDRDWSAMNTTDERTFLKRRRWRRGAKVRGV